MSNKNYPLQLLVNVSFCYRLIYYTLTSMFTSTSELSSLNQVISWLQDLHKKQTKGLLDSSFDIKNYLCYNDMPLYKELILSDENLCFYAAKLFAVHLNTITLIKKRLITREHCYEVTFEIAGELHWFFIKQGWEGVIKEAIGLELNNLLTDTPIRYLCGQDVIITEKVFESLPINLHELRETDDYMFAYGAWETFTHLLRLTDRKTTNVRWNGSRLANIDFGLVFYKGNPVFDSRFTLTKKTAQRTLGQIYALEHILNRVQFHQKKLAVLLVNIDVNFCRNTPCFRIPREPLLVILTALKKIDADILASIDTNNADAIEEITTVIINGSASVPDTKKASVLTSLLNSNGIVYAAIMTNKGVVDEVESPRYLSNFKLKNFVLNQQLLDLISKWRHHTILKTTDNFEQSESIQIDLTEVRLLVIWDKENDLMLLSLLELNASIAHSKVNMSKAIELFINNRLNGLN